MTKLKTLLLMICCFNFVATSQNKYGQLSISVGGTYSAFRGIHKLNFIGYEKSFKFTLGQQLHADYALLRRVSFGLGYTRHRHILNIKNYQYFSGPAIITENPTYIITMNSMYLRVLFHHHNLFKDSGETLDAYFGGQQMITWFKSFDDSKDPNFPENSGVEGEIPSFVAGIRYFPTPQFGIHAEASLPNAYTLSLGVIFRTQGRDKVLKNKFKWFGLRP